MTAALNLYLSTLFAEAGVVVAVGVLVYISALICRGVSRRWRLRQLWDDSTIGAGGFPPPVGRRAGTTAATSAGDSRPFDWQRPA